MIQNPKDQITDENINIIEDVKEQELQDITGGCLYCLPLGYLGTFEASHSLMKGLATGSTMHVAKAVSYGEIAVSSTDNFFHHLDVSTRPCRVCKANAAQYVVTKFLPEHPSQLATRD
jgi:hypothetical protein